MRKLNFDDNWILDNKDNYKTWAEMCRAYNKLFGTEYTRQQFKWHTNQVLGLRLLDYNYTEEHDNWLKANHTKFIHRELADKFNDYFGTTKSYGAIKERCRILGLTIDEDERIRRARYGQELTMSKRRLPVGTIGRPANGYLLIKTSDSHDGWEYLSKYVLRQHGIEVKSGEQTVFLDGNKTNYNPDNLDVMPTKYAPVMMKNKFFSENPIITKTGIKWCELHELLGDVEINDD